MTNQATTIEVTWDGPYSWPSFESKSNLHPIPKCPGVYLQTFEYQDGYLIYAAGITRRPVPTRFREHTRKYMNGEYNVLDIAAAKHRGCAKTTCRVLYFYRKCRERAAPL